jgi:hypothetical protein
MSTLALQQMLDRVCHCETGAAARAHEGQLQAGQLVALQVRSLKVLGRLFKVARYAVSLQE